MKLVSLTWGTTPRLPGLRPTDTGKIQLDNPGDALRNWKLLIKGKELYFISPEGWSRDHSSRTSSHVPGAPTTVFGPMPLTEVYLEWNVDNEAELAALTAGKLTYESPPFGWKPVAVDPEKPMLDQIPAGQMGDA